MEVYCETIYGPQRCKVVREIDKDFAELESISVPDGPFGGVVSMNRRFTAYKAQCWNKARKLNRHATRHELSGRPAWGLSK